MSGTSIDDREKIVDKLDADQLKLAVKRTCSALGENSTFDGIRHLYRAKGNRIMT